MGLKRWILSKILLYGAVFAFFYIVGDILNVIPQAVKDFVGWVRENFTLLAIAFCFCFACWCFTKRGSKAKSSEGE